MTATKPTTAAARYNQLHQVNNNNLAKRTRGPINKRACQRCRQGKIRCDGDAESGKPCSNCDPQHCKYDNSPRKNKQVESLKMRLNVVEEQLIAITSEVGEQLHVKDVEKEILCLLYESKEHFIGYESLFEGLRDALKQSKCMRPILPITFELLKRLGEGKCIPDIMKSLQRFVDCANSDSAMLPQMPSHAEMFKKIEESYLAQTFPTNETILPVDSGFIQPLTISSEVDMGHLNLHSSEDDSSESHSIGFDDAYDANAEPSTPPGTHNQQVHSAETKCFNSNNVPQHMTATSTASEFVGSNFYENQYFPSYQYNMMDAMNPMNPMNQIGFLPPTTTSPTDEQMTWS